MQDLAAFMAVAMDVLEEGYSKNIEQTSLKHKQESSIPGCNAESKCRVECENPEASQFSTQDEVLREDGHIDSCASGKKPKSDCEAKESANGFYVVINSHTESNALGVFSALTHWLGSEKVLVLGHACLNAGDSEVYPGEASLIPCRRQVLQYCPVHCWL